MNKVERLEFEQKSGVLMPDLRQVFNKLQLTKVHSCEKFVIL